MEEKVRFELTVRFRTTVFKTVALILSATSPWSQRMESNHFRYGYVFHTVLLCNVGSPGKTRTCDLQINSLPLYQLSYWGT